MTYRFQVLYRSAGEIIQPIEVKAEALDQVKNDFIAARLDIVAIHCVGVEVDWSKPNFDTDEAAAFYGFGSKKTFVEKRGLGGIPFAIVDDRYVYPRKLQEANIRKHLNPAGKKLASEMESEAA